MNTAIKIFKYGTVQQFKNRLTHNNRNETLKDGVESNIKYLEIDKTKIQKVSTGSEISRGELTNKISRLKHRITKMKKQSTIDRNTIILNDLIDMRDGTQAQSPHNKNNFIDMSLSITLSGRYAKNKTFNKMLAQEAEIFIKQHFPNMEVLNIVGHLDQASAHIHISGQYVGKNNISKDLKDSFGSARSYSKAQQAFNEHIKKSNLVKKFKLNIEDITPHEIGKNPYLPLEKYKPKSQLDKTFSKSTKKIIENSKNWRGAINEEILEKNLIKQLFKASKYKINPLELKEANDTIEAQEDEILTIRSKANNIISAKNSKIKELEHMSDLKDGSMKSMQKTINDQDTTLNELSSSDNELSELKKFIKETNPSFMSEFEKYKMDQPNSHNHNRRGR